jgi:hypothetical protein
MNPSIGIPNRSIQKRFPSKKKQAPRAAELFWNSQTRRAAGMPEVKVSFG